MHRLLEEGADMAEDQREMTSIIVLGNQIKVSRTFANAFASCCTNGELDIPRFIAILNTATFEVRPKFDNYDASQLPRNSLTNSPGSHLRRQTI